MINKKLHKQNIDVNSIKSYLQPSFLKNTSMTMSINISDIKQIKANQQQKKRPLLKSVRQLIPLKQNYQHNRHLPVQKKQIYLSVKNSVNQQSVKSERRKKLTLSKGKDYEQYSYQTNRSHSSSKKQKLYLHSRSTNKISFFKAENQQKEDELRGGLKIFQNKNIYQSQNSQKQKQKRFQTFIDQKKIMHKPLKTTRQIKLINEQTKKIQRKKVILAKNRNNRQKQRVEIKML